MVFNRVSYRWRTVDAYTWFCSSCNGYAFGYGHAIAADTDVSGDGDADSHNNDDADSG